MAGASASGNAYEKDVARILQALKFQDCPILVWGTAGSDKDAPDIDATLCDGSFKVEAKTKKAFEFGSKKFQFKDGRFVLPDHPLFHALFKPDFQPFNGFVPSFLRGDTSQDALIRDRREQREKGNSLDVKFEADDPFLAARYYAAKGVHYIQIEGRGLYHTGSDPYNLGVPILAMDMRVRFRCKTHKSNLNHSVQAQLNCARPPTKSPYDLTDLTRLPPGFSVGSQPQTTV
jgi:hypothetical protein